MAQGAKLSDTVTIKLDTNYPLKLEYKTLDKISLDFILAQEWIMTNLLKPTRLIKRARRS